MTAETQKDYVKRLLLERGDSGVSAHELTYQAGITRAAAIIHDLRGEGMDIVTVQKPGEQATYYYRKGPVRPPPSAPKPQSTALPDEEVSSISWEELGEKFRREREEMAAARRSTK